MVVQAVVTLVVLDSTGRAIDLPSWFNATPSLTSVSPSFSFQDYPQPKPIPDESRGEGVVLGSVSRNVTYSDLDWNGHVNHG